MKMMKMSQTNPMTWVLAVCLMAGTSTLLAQSEWESSSSQNSQPQRQKEREQDWGSREPSQPANRHQIIRGTIDSVSPATWATENSHDAQHCVVRVQLDDGRIEFIDLGSRARMRQVDLAPGDEIQLEGRPTYSDGRRIFIPEHLEVNGETYQFHQGQYAQNNEGSSSSRAGTRTLQGRIQGFRHVYLHQPDGQREQHSLVKLQLRDGRTVVADLGPRTDLEDLDLQKGDRISITGRQGTVNGQSAFLANRLRVGDETIQIARANPGENAEERAANPASNSQSRPFTLRGRVSGYQVITLDSGQKQVSMLNLALADGRSVLIYAGQKRNELDLKDLDLRDEAVIKGHTKNVQGREVLVADSVEFLSPQQNQRSGVGSSGQEQNSSGSGSSSRSQGQSGQDSSNPSQE